MVPAARLLIERKVVAGNGTGTGQRPSRHAGHCRGAPGFAAAEIEMAAPGRRGHGRGHAQRLEGMAKMNTLIYPDASPMGFPKFNSSLLGASVVQIRREEKAEPEARRQTPASRP